MKADSDCLYMRLFLMNIISHYHYHFQNVNSVNKILNYVISLRLI